MERQNSSRGMYRKIIQIVIIPLFILSLVVTGVAIRQSIQLTNEEVRESLNKTGSFILDIYNIEYPGDFAIKETPKGNVLVKGDTIVSGNYEIVDRLKEQTGEDISLIYYDTRMLTTIENEEGNRMIGTGISAVILRDVYQNEASAFYTDLKINDTKWYALYIPIYDSHQKAIGMLGIIKPADRVHQRILRQTVPIGVLMLLVVIGIGWLVNRWTKQAAHHIFLIEKYLRDMSEGRLSGELNQEIFKRGDEIGDMAKEVQRMQLDFRDLIEHDPLTGLYNRRFGNIKLNELRRKSKATGIPFTVAIGDIDFFKKINDTYGHECGDHVLKQVAELLRKHLMGKGFAIRWGGEEMLIIYDHLKLEDAADCLDDFMEMVRETRISYHDQIVSFHMTFGVADGNLEEHAEEIIKRADKRLYYGKEHGRDQVVRKLPDE